MSNAREARRLLLMATAKLSTMPPADAQLNQAKDLATMAIDYLRDEQNMRRRGAGITMGQFANFLVLCCAVAYQNVAERYPQTPQWMDEWGKWTNLSRFARNQYAVEHRPWEEVGNI